MPQYAIKEVDQQGTILNKTSQIRFSADDVIINSSRQQLGEVYKELNKKSAGMGLNLSLIHI